MNLSNPQRFYEKYSWLVFILIAVTGIIPALQLLISPASGQVFFSGFGYPVPDFILDDPAGAHFLTFMMRWIATILIGGNSLTLFIASTAWRRGDRWAWYALWYWPLMFASHFFLYGSGLMKSLQLVWMALTLATLLSNYQRFALSPVPTAAANR